MKPWKILIRNQEWKFIIGKPPSNKCDGYCDYDKFTIWVRPGKNVKIRPTAIHEVLHASLPDIEEGVIIETEKSIERLLKLLDEIEKG